jgi:hypothetical protein
VALLGAVAGVLFSQPAWAVQRIDWVRANPSSVPTGAPVLVTISAQVAADPNLLAASVNLVQYDSAGKPIGTPGRMYDDQTHGDALAGDNIFTTQVEVNQPAPTILRYRVSVAYKGTLRRLLSGIASIDVAVPFFEEVPGWRMPELAVTGLLIAPERSNPGDVVTLSATVANTGRGVASTATLVFSIDGLEVQRVPVAPLTGGEGAGFTATWQAAGSGPHQVRAEILPDGYDRSRENNTRTAVARVSGENPPAPALEFVGPDASPSPGTPLTVKVRNPSFATIGNVPLSFYLDGQWVSAQPNNYIEYLAPGSEAVFQVQTGVLVPGEHLFTVKTFPLVSDIGGIIDPALAQLKSWVVTVAGFTLLYEDPLQDKWVSIGPRILDNGVAGRMNAITFDPRSPYKTAYAAGVGNDASVPAGAGVWKTTDGGGSWFPVGDKLSSMMIAAVAVDPHDPAIVYAGGTHGMFKSVDSGATWSNFADVGIAPETGKIVVRQTASGQVLLYATCQRGVIRYKSGNPLAPSSGPLDWDVIKLGTVSDLAVHPSNSSILYASMAGNGIYRTEIGENAMVETTPGTHSWTKLTAGLPSITKEMRATLDIHPLYPGMLYAGITMPQSGVDFAIYRSNNGGNDWAVIKAYATYDLADDGYKRPAYNPYIRVAPKPATGTYLPEVIYFGGADLYQFVNYYPLTSPVIVPQGGTYMVSGYGVKQRAGADIKALVFHPDPVNQDKYYYSLGDQGIFVCSIQTTPKQAALTGRKYGEAGDDCINRNDNLRVTEFYDFDVSRTNPDLILGGTQDTGTVLFDGDSTWKEAWGGDGMYSLINPFNDSIMYAQHQSLSSTVRSPDGGLKWTANKFHELWENYGNKGYITMDLNPAVADGVIALGKDGNGLLYTTDGGKTFEGLNYWTGAVSTVIVHPTTYAWIIGTHKGSILHFNKGTGITSAVFTHPLGQSVLSLAVSPVNPNRLFATFDMSYCVNCTDQRVYYIDLDSSNYVNSKAQDITAAFPENLTPRVIVGDPYDANAAYVGTERGVWRWRPAGAGMFHWQPYNDGFPLTTVVKLLIAPDKKLLAATKGRGAWRVTVGSAGQ